jgi:hypothetical protein
MEKRLSIDKELRILWKLCLGLEENVKSVKKYVKRVETARYQQKNTQPQAEENEPDKVYVDPIVPDFIKEPPIPAVFKTREEVMRMFESTPEQKEDWEEEFMEVLETFKDEICSNFFASSKPLTDFIQQLLEEREMFNKKELDKAREEGYEKGQDYQARLDRELYGMSFEQIKSGDFKLTTK